MSMLKSILQTTCDPSLTIPFYLQRNSYFLATDLIECSSSQREIKFLGLWIWTSMARMYCCDVRRVGVRDRKESDRIRDGKKQEVHF